MLELVHFFGNHFIKSTDYSLVLVELLNKFALLLSKIEQLTVYFSSKLLNRVFFRVIVQRLFQHCLIFLRHKVVTVPLNLGHPLLQGVDLCLLRIQDLRLLRDLLQQEVVLLSCQVLLKVQILQTHNCGLQVCPILLIN